MNITHGDFSVLAKVKHSLLHEYVDFCTFSRGAKLLMKTIGTAE
jgi:hypothetical protein